MKTQEIELPSWMKKELLSVGIEPEELIKVIPLLKDVHKRKRKIGIIDGKNQDIFFAKILFPEKIFSELEKQKFPKIIDDLLCEKKSTYYKEAFESAEKDFPGLGKMAQKVVYAYDVIMYSNRRTLNTKEQKMFNLLLVDKKCAQLVQEKQIEELWEDVQEERRALKGQIAPVAKMRTLLQDSHKKQFFLLRYLDNFFFSQLIAAAINYNAH